MELIFTPFDSEWRKEWGNIFFVPQNENLIFYFFQGKVKIWGPGKNLFFLFPPPGMGPQKKLHFWNQGIGFRGGRPTF